MSKNTEQFLGGLPKSEMFVHTALASVHIDSQKDPSTNHTSGLCGMITSYVHMYSEGYHKPALKGSN